MSVIKAYNLARMSTTGGSGTLTLGSAIAPWLTFAGAGVVNNDIVYYGIKDGSSNSECGYGTYTSSGTTLSRNVIKSTNSNSAINASSSAEVYITAVVGDGGDWLPGTVNPMRGYDTAINAQLNISASGNALTIALKGNNGNDPSNTNPVIIPFRDTTLTSGDPVWVTCTAATSVVIPSSQAVGTVTNIPFRIWIVALNNAGTVELAVINTVTGGASPTAVFALAEHVLQSTTAIATAPSAGIYYSTTARSSKAIRILGYMDCTSTTFTAGTWVTGMIGQIQLFGPGIKKPGDTVQAVYGTTSSLATTTANTFQNTNLSVNITPTASPNLVLVTWCGNLFTSAGSAANAIAQVFSGSSGIGLITAVDSNIAGSDHNSICAVVLDAPGVSSSRNYIVKVKNDDNASTVGFGTSYSSGVSAAMTLLEIMS